MIRLENLQDSLKHHGVKGMKWGIRRDYNRPGGADGVPDAKDKEPRTTLGRKLNSLKRERQWKSVLKKIDNLSTKDINEVTKRVTLENNLKTLSRSKVATKKDKDDYLRREKMSNQELARKVARLRAKDNLNKAINDASKEQREFGEKVVQIGSSLGVRYAINKGQLTTDDFIDVFTNPKSASNKAKEDVQKELGRRGRDMLKDALEKTKSRS